MTTTARLRLEPVGPQHHAGLLRLLGDPRVGATLGGVRDAAAVTAGIERTHADWTRDGFGLWAAVDPRNGEVVGRGGLAHLLDADTQPEVEVAWAVVPERWGEGLATEIGAAALELARERRLPSVVAVTLHDNRASRRVMEKLRFAYERDVVHADLPHVLYRAGTAGSALAYD